MKQQLRVLALVCIISVLLTMMIPALAEKASYNGIGKMVYTVTTGQKDATLKITVAKGKLRGTVRSWFFGIKHSKTKRCDASYTVTVTDHASQDVSSDIMGDASYKLQNGRSYYVTIEFNTWLPGTLSDMSLEDTEFVAYPTVNLNVDHKAKIEEGYTGGNGTGTVGGKPSSASGSGGNQGKSIANANAKKQYGINYDGLAAWWAGSDAALRDYIGEMDKAYGRVENNASRTSSSNIIIGSEAKGWMDGLNQFADNSSYAVFIRLGCRNYNCYGKSVWPIASETLGWGGADNAPKYKDEYYLFEVGDGKDIDKICIRMSNTGDANGTIEGRIYESSRAEDTVEEAAVEEAVEAVEEVAEEEAIEAVEKEAVEEVTAEEAVEAVEEEAVEAVEEEAVEAVEEEAVEAVEEVAAEEAVEEAEAEEVQPWDYEPLGDWDDINDSCELGLINGLMGDVGEEFFARYPRDQLTLMNDYDYSDEDVSDWTIGTLLSMGGSMYCVVDCEDYADIRAEATHSSRSLQSVNYGEGIPVLGFWEDWAICVCSDSDEEYPVCGWIETRYLVSEEEFAGDDAYSGDYSAEEPNYYDEYEEPFDDSDGYEDETYYGEPTGEYIGTMVVGNCDEWVSLRESPDTGADRLAQVFLGDTVEAYSFDESWYECEYNGEWGFILSKYLILY